MNDFAVLPWSLFFTEIVVTLVLIRKLCQLLPWIYVSYEKTNTAL